MFHLLKEKMSKYREMRQGPKSGQGQDKTFTLSPRELVSAVGTPPQVDSRNVEWPGNRWLHAEGWAVMAVGGFGEAGG